jgi:transposase
MRINPSLQLMQDGAPRHATGDTQVDLKERGITLLFWPAFSPDLNLIETVWNWMKDYIKAKYPEKDCTYD